MNLKKSLTTLALGLTLVGGVLGASNVAPAAHAAVGANPSIIAVSPVLGPIGTGPIVRRIRPVISEQSYNCGVTITGKYFTPSAQVKVLLIDSASGKTVTTLTSANAAGSITVDVGTDHLGPNVGMIAQDLATFTYSNGVYDLAFCIK